MIYALVTLWLAFIAIMGNHIPPDPPARRAPIALGPAAPDLSWIWAPLNPEAPDWVREPIRATKEWLASQRPDFDRINNNIKEMYT